MDNRYNRHNRRKYSLKVHIVLVTKYRKQVLKGSIADDVKQRIFDIANTHGYEIIAIENTGFVAGELSLIFSLVLYCPISVYELW